MSESEVINNGRTTPVLNLSEVINNGTITPGCIYRIALENFLTYNSVELFPGPSLNLIIGPNGTGKSTFVCAIILGLCGKISVIGRSKKISDYVRSGCLASTIHMELYQHRGQRNVIITRQFNVYDQSTWFIDYKHVNEKKVKRFIASLNIQVDNLCQLLPQDRVQDFSKLNPEELLRSTLSAVGGQEAISQLQELIDYRAQQMQYTSKLAQNTQVIEVHRQHMGRLNVIIEGMRQRKELEKQIEIYENKKLWIEYNELREKVLECAKDMNNAKNIVKSHRSKVKPFEEEIAATRENIKLISEQILKSGNKIFDLKDKAKKTQDTIKLQPQYKEIRNNYQRKVDRYNEKMTELHAAKTLADKLSVDKRRLMDSIDDEPELNSQYKEIYESTKKTNMAIEKLKKDKLFKQCELDNNVKSQITFYQSRIRNIEDQGKSRLETLRSWSERSTVEEKYCQYTCCYKAVLWLRKNRHLFQKGAVHEPIMLEIKFTDPKYAKYIESSIPEKDLLAFTFESSQDMNLFLAKVRQEQGLKRVNALCSQGGAVELPGRNIQQLSQLGFTTYLVDTISAPDAIVRYLCNKHYFHKIPIGNDDTYNNSEKVPDGITKFFTENHKFTVRVSAYSGEKSYFVVETKKPRLLANIVDTDKLDQFEKELSKLKTTAQVQEDQIKAIDRKISVLDVGLNELNKKKKNIYDTVQKIRNLSVQIKLQTKKVQELETETIFDKEKEKRIYKSELQDCIKKECRLQYELRDIVDKLHSETLRSTILKVKIEIKRGLMLDKENELKEMQDEANTLQTTLQTIKQLHDSTKASAVAKLKRAKQSSNNKMPGDKDFPYNEHFNNTSSDLTTLHRLCYELQARMELINQGDDTVIKEYEDREREIAQLNAEMERARENYQQLEERMKAITSHWMPNLKDLLVKIDKSFGNMFAQLGCAGEIQLSQAGSELDFDKYGISIMVQFRSSEQMQRLNRHTQSGGERVLCTALYLIALQRLTTVPFRCMDEINQGMDPINERKLFELLLKVTTECDNAQCFLLSPKLLKNLQYNDKIKVHTIMNGQEIMEESKWQISSFLQKAQNSRKRFKTGFS